MNNCDIGIIGLGAISRFHIDAVKKVDGARIICVCDLDEAAVKQCSNELSCAGYTDIDEMLASQACDLVLVLTPPGSHASLVKRIAAVGANVFCEKPIALSVMQAEDMIEACETAGVSLFYGSSMRYLPAVRKAKELIAAGAIGDVQAMHEMRFGGGGCDNYKPLNDVHYPSGGPGGWGMGLMDHGIHLVDIFCWFIDREILHVAGRGQIAGEEPITEFLHIEFEGGAICSLVYNGATYSAALPNEGLFAGGAGWSSSDNIIERGEWDSDPATIFIYGGKGALRCAYYSNKLFLCNESGIQSIELAGRPPGEHFITQIESCLAVLKDGGAPEVGGKEALRALKLVLPAFSRSERRQSARPPIKPRSVQR